MILPPDGKIATPVVMLNFQQRPVVGHILSTGQGRGETCIARPSSANRYRRWTPSWLCSAIPSFVVLCLQSWLYSTCPLIASSVLCLLLLVLAGGHHYQAGYVLNCILCLLVTGILCHIFVMFKAILFCASCRLNPVHYCRG